MKSRKALLLLCGIILSMLAASVAIKSSQPTTPIATAQAQDPKAQIKHQRREARYSDPRLREEVLKPMSEYKEDVIFNYSIFHFVESKDLADAAVRSALQSEDLVSRQKLVCSTPLIVQGEVIKSAGVITDDDRYIYTVYTFLVTNVLRSSPGINVNVNDQIEITSWGGVVKNDARTLTYLHSTIRQLNVNSQYLLYLKNDQEAGDYYLFDAAGIYQLDDGLVIRMDTLLDPIFAQRARAAEVPTTGAGIKAEIASTTCGK